MNEVAKHLVQELGVATYPRQEVAGDRWHRSVVVVTTPWGRCVLAWCSGPVYIGMEAWLEPPELKRRLGGILEEAEVPTRVGLPSFVIDTPARAGEGIKAAAARDAAEEG